MTAVVEDAESARLNADTWARIVAGIVVDGEDGLPLAEAAKRYAEAREALRLAKERLHLWCDHRA